jgi:hypothetical protein
MQPKSLDGAGPGFRVLNENAASAAVRRHSRLPFATRVSEWDALHRCPDRTIDMDLYRRHIAARRRVAREQAALTSACVGVVAMIALYVALFFAADHARTTNQTQPATPISVAPVRGAADARF